MPIDPREMERIVTGATEIDSNPAPAPESDAAAEPKCPHCGYIVAGLPRSVCPECGKKIDWSRVLPDETLVELLQQRRNERIQLAIATAIYVLALGIAAWQIGNVYGALACAGPFLGITGIFIGYRLINGDDLRDPMWFLAAVAVVYAVFLTIVM